MKTTHPACLVPNCKRPVIRRGLCDSDYNAAARLVRDGVISWIELEKAGKALPRMKSGPANESRKFFLGKKAIEKDFLKKASK
jgi:hypothetical protein